MTSQASPISQRTRSGTASNQAESFGDGSKEDSLQRNVPKNTNIPYQHNKNEPLEAKEVSSRRNTWKKKQQQVQFNTNIPGPSQDTLPVFLLRPPEMDNNKSDQSDGQNRDVNNNYADKQTLDQTIGQTSADPNKPKSDDNAANDRQVVLPEIEMSHKDQDDVNNRHRKLENYKFFARLHIPIDN
jgi:hypothetical protein